MNQRYARYAVTSNAALLLLNHYHDANQRMAAEPQARQRRAAPREAAYACRTAAAAGSGTLIPFVDIRWRTCRCRLMQRHVYHLWLSSKHR
jgi:hypothetical protein